MTTELLGIHALIVFIMVMMTFYAYVLISLLPVLLQINTIASFVFRFTSMLLFPQVRHAVKIENRSGPVSFLQIVVAYSLARVMAFCCSRSCVRYAVDYFSSISSMIPW